MPLQDNQNINLNKNPLKELVNDYHVNVLNESDPFYTDRCFVYKINGTDIPLNSRRSKIFPNVTSTCGQGCDYKGIDSNGFMDCNCHNPTKCSSGDLIQDFKETILDTINTSNIFIFKCDVNNLIMFNSLAR